MKKSLIISGGIVFLLIILGIYFFMRGNNGDDLITQKNKLENNLIVARGKLEKEKQKLENIKSELADSFPFAMAVQDQMKKASNIVKQTDFLFTDASGLNPELIIKNLLNGIRINNERKDINILLIEWQKKIDILAINKIDIVETEKIKKEIETIKIFVEELSQLVGSLTETNSGLSQFQIDIYSLQLPSIESINEVLASIETVIQNANNTSVSSLTNTPLVTPNDVVIEQAVVTQIQNEVTTLQEQLTQVEEQAGQASTPFVPPVEIFQDANSTLNDTNSENLPNQNNNNNFPSIIITPGLPRLIQGSGRN